MSDILRITGMATGLDVDSMVKQMMQAESMKVDKAKQQRQLTQWTQDAYRDIIGDLNTFKSSYFDILKPDSYMLSSNSYAGFDVTSSDTTNSMVTATPTTNAAPGTYTISNIVMATKATYSGSGSVNTAANAVSSLSIDSTGVSGSPNGSFNVSVNGSPNIQINIQNGTYASVSDLAYAINNQFNANGISNQVSASVSTDGKLQFMSKDSNTVNISDINALSNLGFTASSINLGPTVSNVEQANNPYSQLNITSANNTLNLSVATTTNGTTSTKSYTVTLNTQTYASTGDLATQINSALATAKDSSGNTVDLSSVLNASTSTDNSKITFAPANSTTTSISVTGNNTSSNVMTFGDAITTGTNDSLTLRIGTTSFTATLGASTGSTGYDSPSDLVTKINNALKTASGGGSNNVDLSGVVTAKLSADGTRILFAAKTADSVNVSGNALSGLGFSSSSFDINQSTSDSMINQFSGLTDAQLQNMSFSINGSAPIVYDFSSTGAQRNWSIGQVMSDISSKANVNMTYNQLTRTFSITSNTTGANQTVNVTATSGTNGSTFLSTLFGANPISQNGTDAIATIKEPGSNTPVTITRSTNNFTIDGMSYSLVGNTTGSVNLTVTSDTDKIYNKITDFVTKYNDLIDKISSKLQEEKQYSYQPLTDAQKKAMNDTDIANWESKAKQGLLRGDSNLETMLSNMRNAFYDMVKPAYSDDPSDRSNIGISLSDIGLSTSDDIEQGGKITIDEYKLKAALQNNGDKVAQLFMKTSTVQPYYSATMDSTTRKHRYQEEGIFQRISDILQDNVRTTRDNNGRKGVLLEKAGIQGDYSEFNNLLTNELNEQDKAIDDLNQKMADKQTAYYTQFSQLETAMQQLNSQSSWLSSQLGSMGGSQG